LQDYLALVQRFNQGAHIRVYPGSPFILQQLLREHDKLKLFELHPTDLRALAGNVAQLNAGRQVAVLQEDGFEGLRRFLPPPSRRALVLCDPSYELKSDYARVPEMLQDALKRFATGTYAVWYPIIPRPEAHDLPRRLKSAATKAGKSGRAPRPGGQRHVPGQPSPPLASRLARGTAPHGGTAGARPQCRPPAGVRRLKASACSAQ
jgi:23S rRNA (adenine2030-N6)-methyltransferase